MVHISSIVGNAKQIAPSKSYAVTNPHHDPSYLLW